MDRFRSAVSSDRIHFMDKRGREIDLTYIARDVLAMSMPAKRGTLESLWRNRAEDVVRVLKRRHGDGFMIWRLSEQQNYDYKSFDDQIIDYSFPDHHPPPMDWLCEIVNSVFRWLQSTNSSNLLSNSLESSSASVNAETPFASPSSPSSSADVASFSQAPVAVIHCKGGKGRTGVIVSSILYFRGLFPSGIMSAEAHFARCRSKTGAGVQGASQRRYLRMFQELLQSRVDLNPLAAIPTFHGSGKRPFIDIRTRAVQLTEVVVGPLGKHTPIVNLEVFEYAAGATFDPLPLLVSVRLSADFARSVVARTKVTSQIKPAVDWIVRAKQPDGQLLFSAVIHPLWAPYKNTVAHVGDREAANMVLDVTELDNVSHRLRNDFSITLTIESTLLSTDAANPLWPAIQDEFAKNLRTVQDSSILTDLPQQETIALDGSNSAHASVSPAARVAARAFSITDRISGTERLDLLSFSGRVQKFIMDAEFWLESANGFSAMIDPVNRQRIYLVLFSHLLLCAQEMSKLRRSINGKPYELKAVFSLARCAARSASPTGLLKYGIIVECSFPRQSIRIACDSIEEEQLWLDALNECISSALSEETAADQRSSVVGLDDSSAMNQNNANPSLQTNHQAVSLSQQSPTHFVDNLITF